VSQAESPAPPEKGGLIERASDLFAKGSLVAMMLVIGVEMLLRNTIHYSWEGTDETSSYLVVALTFFSLATCQINHGYHELELVKGRLSPRARALLDATLHLVCLLCALILLWHFCRLVGKSWSSGETSATALRVPYWIPQLSMPLGVAAFCISLAKSVRGDLAAFKRHARADGPRP
jgi:TRAP-type C4-dicarboxylate transport system permease small subunit